MSPRILSPMNRAHALAILNGRLLATYSRRTVEALRQLVPLRVALPHLEPVLALNVDKEVRKDALVIECAGQAVETGSAPERGMVEQVLEATKKIDREFLERVDAFPVRIVIRYEDIAPARVQRIECLLGTAYRILSAWKTTTRLRLALRAAYTQPELARTLHDVLRLYAIETRALSRSVRMPGLLTPLRDRVAQNLFGVMDETARNLSLSLARGVFRSRQMVRPRDVAMC